MRFNKATDMTEIELTEFQKNLLSYLDEILNYGNEKMSKTPLDITKVRKKKQILYLTTCATQSYAEAIRKLIAPPVIYDKAAEVLFRSLSEALINLHYIFKDRTEKNALIFMADSILDSIDFSEKYKKFSHDHPTWKLTFAGLKTDQDWQLQIDELTKNKNLISKKTKKPLPTQIPSLRNRAIIADRYLAKKGKLKRNNSIEYTYITYYKFYSQITHLTMPGLERFMQDVQGKQVVIVDGSANDLERIAVMTYITYHTILRFCLQQFDLFDRNEYQKFKDYAKTIINHR